jgi:hypothetical protein
MKIRLNDILSFYLIVEIFINLFLKNATHLNIEVKFKYNTCQISVSFDLLVREI